MNAADYVYPSEGAKRAIRELTKEEMTELATDVVARLANPEPWTITGDTDCLVDLDLLTAVGVALVSFADFERAMDSA
jgi:hypothetical protein